MLYLAIDLHGKQWTVSVRNEGGETIRRRQVSTERERVRKFLAELAELAQPAGGFVAILEVCGFHDWALKLLAEYGCRETVLVQPTARGKRKTDRRDAQQLGELLWVNRARLLAGRSVQGVRRVAPPSEVDGENRQLTALRQRAGRLRTRTLNRIQRLLLKHNLSQDCPTKGIQTQRARVWLRSLPLPEKQWHAKIKRRRGSKIARVAVMRRLATILWHMARRGEPYVLGGARRTVGATAGDD